MLQNDLYTLDLTSTPPPAHHLPTHVRLQALADFTDTPATRVQLYALVRQGVLDTPGEEGDFVPLDVFEQYIFVPSYWAEADTQVLALAGSDWVGLSSLRRTATPGVSAFGLTVVTPEYRGRGIASALKRRAINTARARGDRSVTTEVHPDNVPMQAVNARLGFQLSRAN